MGRNIFRTKATFDRVEKEGLRTRLLLSVRGGDSAGREREKTCL